MKLVRLVGASLAFVALSVTTATAQDGDVAETSTVTTTIDFTINPLVYLVGVNTDLASANDEITSADAVTDPGLGTTVFGYSDDVCVYTNSVGNIYNVTLTGAASGGHTAFVVSKAGATTNTIAYRAYWNDADAGISEQQATHNTQLSSDFVGTGDPACPSNNATIRVEFDRTALLEKPTGNYIGTLQIVVAPAT